MRYSGDKCAVGGESAFFRLLEEIVHYSGESALFLVPEAAGCVARVGIGWEGDPASARRSEIAVGGDSKLFLTAGQGENKDCGAYRDDCIGRLVWMQT